MPVDDHGRKVSPVSDARVKFLTSASQLLSNTSNSTSAFLGSHQLDILHSKRQGLPNSLRHSLCCACGSLKLTDISSPSPRASVAKRTKRRKGAKAELPLPKPLTHAVIQQCMTCDQYIRHSLPSPAPDTRRSGDQHGTFVPTSPAIHQPAPTDNADHRATQRTGKQRAKMRKANELASLLQSSKKSSETATQLDLMDFLR